jgi:hypothetical protein
MVYRSGDISRQEESLRTVLAVAFMVMLAVQAKANFLDGKTLRDWCSSKDAGNQAACLGYVIAVADILSSDDRGELTKRRACVPNIGAAQAVDAAKVYLRDNPQMGDVTASTLVTIALAKAFPCP